MMNEDASDGMDDGIEEMALPSFGALQEALADSRTLIAECTALACDDDLASAARTQAAVAAARLIAATAQTASAAARILDAATRRQLASARIEGAARERKKSANEC